MANNKDIKYFNRDFQGLKNLLVDYTKTYFPDTYNDFSPSSPGTMFMEMAAYVGDVLSFYLDNQIQETFIQYARQSENIYSLAYMLGYRPKVTKAATVDIDVYQQVPSILDGIVYVPDYNYCLQFSENTQIKSSANNSIFFLIQDNINFAVSSSIDPTEITVYQTSGGNPQYFLLKKTRQAISSQIKSTSFTFGTPESFQTVSLTDDNILQILDITDSDGNTWYEVPYLGQEMIYESIKNTNTNDPNTYQNTDAPYLLRLRKTPRRFVTRFTSTGNMQIQFGSGTTNDVDEVIVPNSDNVGLGLPYKQSKMFTAFDPTNFLQTDTYGISPANTTLTVRYLVGGGVSSNVDSNTLNALINANNASFIQNNLNQTTANYIFGTIALNNQTAASGGSDGDTLEEIRQNSLVTFQSQLRNVTQADYLVRTLSMPSNYGSIAKAYAEPVKIENLLPGETPSVLDIYVLGYNADSNLTTVSDTVKSNLQTYLYEYRMINDSIRIRDGFVINIGVNFDIIVLPNFNSNEVLINCVNALKTYFNIENWSINQPIILKDLYIELSKVQGVQTIKDIQVINKSGIINGYSQYAYDIIGANQNGTIYPSLDPSIFEIKYPDSDIQGRVVSF
jgi:hypothetical protein